MLSASSVAAVSASVAEQEEEDTSPSADLAGCDCIQLSDRSSPRLDDAALDA